MRREIGAARAAYQLWRDDSTTGTVAASVLVIGFIGWPLYQLWRANRAAG